MEFEDLTGFTAAAVPWCPRAGDYRLTVLVKAGFALGADGGLMALDEQPLPRGDQPVLQGPDDPTALDYAADAVPFKPRADVLLRGTAHVAGETPQRALRVGLGVGGMAKSLAVFGPRHYQGGVLGRTVTEPEPFREMPLAYANAYGGDGDPRNPVGKGRRGETAPNIEYLDPEDRRGETGPRPAGFGPISPNWAPRKTLVGTYRGDYRDAEWPGFPRDFDWGYFNAAPSDQQLAGYLRGDEAITLEGVFPEQALYRTRLPGLRTVCLRENADAGAGLVPMHLDTLWLDTDARELHLVWRGVTPVATFEALDVERLAFFTEALDAAEEDAAAYQRRLAATIAEQDQPFQAEAPAEGPAPSPPAEEPSPAEPASTDEPILSPELTERVEALQRRRGDGSAAPPELSAQARAEGERVLREIEERQRLEADAEDAAVWTRERVIAAAQAGESLAGADLRGLDLSRCAFAGIDFAGARLNGTDLTASVLTGAALAGCAMTDASFTGADLTEADLAGADLRGASLTDATLARVRLPRARLSSARLDRADLTQAACPGAAFEGASLVGATLVHAELAEADFSGARLDHADLWGCAAPGAVFNGASMIAAHVSAADLAEAVLDAVDLTDAKLGGSDLRGASAADATLRGANLREADLSEGICNAAVLEGAILDELTAVDADFSGADLRHASLRRASLEGAWFSSAILDGADLSGADCTDLQLDATSARGAVFDEANITTLRGSGGADLSGARFRRAAGAEPIFEGCVLGGADFAEADLPGANFVQVAAAEADFTAADMAGARFTLARCPGARFDDANLFEASLEGTDLSDASLRGANLYGVELLDATLEGAAVDGANLLMTKLAPA